MPDSLPWDHFANDTPLSSASPEPVIVIGSGLAGSWCARTLAEAGLRVIVLEAGTSSAVGASSNPAGIVKPFVTRSPSHAMSFYVEAHRYLLDRLAAWELAEACDYRACGVVQLVENAYPDSTHYAPVAPDKMPLTLGVPSDSHGLLFESSGWLNPSALCQRLLQHQRIALRCQTSVVTIEPCVDEKWRVGIRDDSEGTADAMQASHVVVATGAVLDKLALTSHLTITPARGQISRFAVAPNLQGKLASVVSGNHYIIPDGDSVIIGASFERGVSDDFVKPEDDNFNRAGAAQTLPSLKLCGESLEAFAGVRATTPDRLPLVGPLPDKDACERSYTDLRHGRPLTSYCSLPVHKGVFVLGGLGSRGIVTAPFASRLLVDHILGSGDIMHWSSLINPARFQIRNLKRGQS